MLLYTGKKMKRKENRDVVENVKCFIIVRRIDIGEFEHPTIKFKMIHSEVVGYKNATNIY